jgi:hypothetical protein
VSGDKIQSSPFGHVLAEFGIGTVGFDEIDSEPLKDWREVNAPIFRFDSKPGETRKKPSRLINQLLVKLISRDRSVTASRRSVPNRRVDSDLSFYN